MGGVSPGATGFPRWIAQPDFPVSRVTFGAFQRTFDDNRNMKKTSPVSRSGRFTGGPGADVAQFTESISFDWRLWRHDILGSMVHATMLQKAGLLTQAELRAIVKGLDAIGREIKAGKFRWKPELEDVHMNIEAELTRRTPAGAKLHTGRSRNDQVALDMRLWLRDEIVVLQDEIRSLQGALVQLGDAERRGHHSRLHASATGAAGLFRASSARLRGDAGAGPAAAGGLPRARERLPARQRRHRRFHAAAGPGIRRETARFRGREGPAARHAKFHGRRERPGFRGGILRRRRR